MNIDLSKLLQIDGGKKEYSLDNIISSINVDDIEYKVCQYEPMILNIQNEGDQVLNISYSGAADVIIPCSRCLEPVKYNVKFEDKRKIDMKQPEDEREDDAFFIIERTLFPEMLFMDEILLRWPIRVLCREDCKGICSRCGANLNKGACSCEEEATDPRMAAIKDIFSQYKEV